MQFIGGNSVGIIPACAGSSVGLDPPRAARGDLPRGCGEQPAIPAQPLRVSGSSPRVRGAGENIATVRIGEGIIPACAGSRLRML